MIRIVSVGLLVILAGTLEAPARAQEGYPPVLPTACLVLSGQIQIRDGRIFVLVRGHLVAEGGPGCGRGRGTATILSDPVFFGSTTAGEDGSYRIEGNLPAAVRPGDHQFIVDFGGTRRYVQPITVVSSFVSSTATGGGGSTPTLPRTGRDIARMILWGILLVAAGTALVIFAKGVWRARPELRP